jgi:SAM-dependent methyltransferase
LRSLTDLLATLGARSTLDVGCGCGEFSRTLTPFCERLVCIDAATTLGSRWSSTQGDGRLALCCMDARRMGFRTSSFPVVVERASLHHIAEWERVLDEMFRVSGAHVLIEEPVDDPRSSAKMNTIKAQELFSELQNEVGISHFRHFDPAVLLAAVARRGVIRLSEVVRTDDPVRASEYFAAYPRFAAQSQRPGYWEARLRTFLENLGNGTLCESDSLLVLAEVTKP